MTQEEFRRWHQEIWGYQPSDWIYNPRQSQAKRLARSVYEIKEYWLAECFKRCLLTENALDFRQAYTQEQPDGHRTLITFKCDNQYVSQLAVAQYKGKLYALVWWNREYVLRPDTKALVVYQPS